MSQFFLMCFLLLSNIAAGLAVFLLWRRRFAADAAFSAFARRARLYGAICAALGALAVPAAGLFGEGMSGSAESAAGHVTVCIRPYEACRSIGCSRGDGLHSGAGSFPCPCI